MVGALAGGAREENSVAPGLTDCGAVAAPHGGKLALLGRFGQGAWQGAGGIAKLNAKAGKLNGSGPRRAPWGPNGAKGRFWGKFRGCFKNR